MNFAEVLRRYHIEPLSYGDGMPLQEKDYLDLLKLLVKYEAMKAEFGAAINYQVEPRLLRKVESLKKNSLIEPEEADVMDCLMEQNNAAVVSG